MKKKRLLLRIIIIMFGLLCLFLFIVPLFYSASLNIGNVTGMICSSILIIYGMLFHQINRLFCYIHKYIVGRIVLGMLVAAVVLLAATVTVETVCMVRYAAVEPSEDATVVVLGCRVYGNRASLSMVERLDAAYTYLEEHEEAQCVLSGGMGPGEGISEAQCMYDYLVEKGIDKKRLYMEDKSTDTVENLTYTKELIEKEGLNKEMAIVTSEYHEYRASLIADSLSVEHAAVPAHTAWWLLPTNYVRELYGILHQWIVG